MKLMTIYGLGFIALFVIFALLYANVWRRRQAMGLVPLEVHDAYTGMVSHLLSASVGLLSILIVVVGGDRMSMWSGISYSLLGPVHGVWGFLAGKERERLRDEANLPV